MNDKTASLGLVDATTAEVEQLLIVESTGRRRVAGAFDLPGLDLQVGDRVGAATVGEHQVLVRLVGIDALGNLADQHIADPDGVCSLSLQRTPIVHVAPGARGIVIDEQPMFEVLAGVGEVQT